MVGGKFRFIKVTVVPELVAFYAANIIVQQLL